MSMDPASLLQREKEVELRVLDDLYLRTECFFQMIQMLIVRKSSG